MDQKILWVVNHMPKTDDKSLPTMGLEEIAKARTSHEDSPQYTKAPFTKLDHMAAYLGVKKVCLKDESHRFGFSALKVPGGPFSMARYIAGGTGRDISEFPHSVLTPDQLREEFDQTTFFTATDSNHERSVAWAVSHLGQRAAVHMPKGSTRTRLENVVKEDAQVNIQEMNHDDCVRLAVKEADGTPKGVIVQDTAWNGYEEILSWIMQGYGTMAMEAGEQLREYGYEHSTRIFVQTDVGSLVDAIVGCFFNLYAGNPPVLVVVEVEVTACLYKGITAGDGQVHIVDGDMETIATGLACGEPNTISWDVLKNHVKIFIAVPDWVAANGMRMLDVPIKSDAPVISGESDAAPFGALVTIMSVDEYIDLRKDIGLDENSRMLLFSAEGDTDPDCYKNTMWKDLNK